MLQSKRCPNDNHGRMVVTVRCCPNCGEIVNANIHARKCVADSHAKMRRSRHSFCMDCGAGLA